MDWTREHKPIPALHQVNACLGFIQPLQARRKASQLVAGGMQLQVKLSTAPNFFLPRQHKQPTLGSRSTSSAERVARLGFLGLLQTKLPGSQFTSNRRCLTLRSTGRATAGGVSLMCGAFGTFAHQAYAACLRAPVSSNVRRHKLAHSQLQPSKYRTWPSTTSNAP